MCQLKGKGSFVSRNLVAIVMIPSLIGLHYGWELLQKNDVLVSKEERIEMPIVKAVKSIWMKLQGTSSGETSK